MADELWTAANSPYCVTGDLRVSQLNIEPGVEVLVDGAYAIDVLTAIGVVGSAGAEILFSAFDSDTPWRGFKFQNTGPGSNFTHVIIEYSNESGMTLTDTVAPVLDHCVFQNNSRAGHGGAINASGLLSDLNLVNCIFSQNTANPAQAIGDYVGGALYLQSVDANITNSVFTGNRVLSRCFAPSTNTCGVTARGGAIWLGGGNVTLANNEFVNNSVDALNQGFCPVGGFGRSYGGALYVDSGNVTLANNVLGCNVMTANCRTTLAGAGLYVNGGTVEVANATIAHNSSTGLHLDGGTLDVTNSIVFFQQ